MCLGIVVKKGRGGGLLVCFSPSTDATNPIWGAGYKDNLETQKQKRTIEHIGLFG